MEIAGHTFLKERMEGLSGIPEIVEQVTNNMFVAMPMLKVPPAEPLLPHLTVA